MAETGNSQNVGTLVTTFAADFSPLRQAITKDYASLLNQVKNKASKINIPIGGASSSSAKSIIPDNVGKQAGINFANSFIKGMEQTLSKRMLAGSAQKLLMGADWGFAFNKGFGDFYKKSFTQQQKFLGGSAQKLLGRGIVDSPNDSTMENIRARKARTAGLEGMFGSFGRGIAYKFPEVNARAIRDFNNQLDNLSGTFMKVGAATSVASAGIALFSKSSIMASADYTEWQNVFQQSFKEVLPQATIAVNKFAKDFDLSRKTAQRNIGDVGELLGGIGFSGKTALEMSMRLNTVAADITSFRNITGSGLFPTGIQRASHAAFMAMMGNSQSAKILGVAIRQNSPEFKLMEKRIMDATGATLQQARAIAVLNEIERQSKFTVGDYSRTWGTFSNSLRRVQERFEDLKISFGDILIRGLNLNLILSGIAVGIKKTTDALNEVPWGIRTVIGLVTVAGIAIGPLIVGVGMLGFAITGLIRGIATLGVISPTLGKLFATGLGIFKIEGIKGLFPLIGKGIVSATIALAPFLTKMMAITAVFMALEKSVSVLFTELSSWNWFEGLKAIPKFNNVLPNRYDRPSMTTEAGKGYSAAMSKTAMAGSKFQQTTGRGAAWDFINSYIPMSIEWTKSFAEGYNPMLSDKTRMQDYIKVQLASGKNVDLNYLENLEKKGMDEREYTGSMLLCMFPVKTQPE